VVSRFADIELSYVDRDGAVRTRRVVRGLTAGTFQHECDHLDGTIFVDRVTDPTTLSHVGGVRPLPQGGVRRAHRAVHPARWAADDAMPAEGIHLTALREAAFSGALAAEPRQTIVRYEDAARLGAIVLDLPYFDRYLEEVVRYALRLPPQASPWGAAVHERAAVPIVRALLERARRERSQRLLALALGAASHAALDRALHPLINALARRFAQGRSHDEAHREVEKFQSICFHEAYFGRDRMGTPGIVRLVAVPALELLADPPRG
jgi:hypothetical protein